MRIGRTYRFEAAHRLPLLPENHKCHNLHGHNYRIEITVAGCVDSRGFIMDFSELDSIVLPLIARCDHRILNDVPGLENPTAELIALWFHTNLSNPIRQAMASLPEFTVRVWENDHCWAEFP